MKTSRIQEYAEKIHLSPYQDPRIRKLEDELNREKKRLESEPAIQQYFQEKRLLEEEYQQDFRKLEKVIASEKEEILQKFIDELANDLKANRKKLKTLVLHLYNDHSLGLEYIFKSVMRLKALLK